MFYDLRRFVSLSGFEFSQEQMNPPSQKSGVGATISYVDDADAFNIVDDCSIDPYYDQYRWCANLIAETSSNSNVGSH